MHFPGDQGEKALFARFRTDSNALAADKSQARRKSYRAYDSAAATAAVGPIDDFCTKWISSYRQQAPTDNHIETFGTVLSQILDSYLEGNGLIPTAILVFCNGSTDGQFREVRLQEVN